LTHTQCHRKGLRCGDVGFGPPEAMPVGVQAVNKRESSLRAKSAQPREAGLVRGAYHRGGDRAGENSAKTEPSTL